MGDNKPKISKRKTENTVINLFLKIQMIGAAIYILMFLLSCFTAVSLDFGQNYDMIFSLGTFAICSFLTALYAGLKIREHGLPVGIVYTLPLNTLIVLLSLFFTDFKADFRILLTSVVLLLFAGVGGITGVNIRLRR